MNTLKTLSLGQKAKFGTLYDARSDSFLDESLITSEIPPNAACVTSTPLNRAETAIVETGTIRERFDKLDVGPELAASLLAGLVSPRGAARYLAQQGASVPAAHRAVVHTAMSKMDQLIHDWESLLFLLNDERQLLKGFPVGDEMDVPGNSSKVEGDDDLKIRLYTDAREVLDGQTDNLADAAEHFSQLQPYVKSTGGKPLVYTLLPVAFLINLGVVIPNNVVAGQLSPMPYDQVVGLVDHLASLHRTLNGHQQRLAQRRGLVNDSHWANVKEEARGALAAEESFRAGYSGGLSTVRDNTATSQAIVNFANESNREIIDRTSSIYNAFYVFHFNDTVMDAGTSWEENKQLFEELLSQQPIPHVVLVDSDTQNLTQPYITVYANGTLVVDNLLEQNKELADKHLVRYDRSFLEQTADLPTYRKSLHIPCPGPYCSEQDLCLWWCSDCHETIEFGSRDGFFYCDCGRVPFDRASFNCQRPRHKAGYFDFDRNDLRSLLVSLPAPRETNILILGETGDLKDPKLNCIIPCSFTTKLVNLSSGLPTSKTITIGKEGKDEHDGSSGSSATQKATVYSLYFRDMLIRLIDTPSIGDTRGIDQDKQNMAKMLSILRNYPQLHGNFILLKPNNARLGVMFRFCVKELLTHLHTSAAQNMVFGITNARGSNYTPGDTFKPLETLLSSYKNDMPPLSRSNIYCFDSESFRYLAARKKGVETGHIDDYRRSWEHSAQEADRLLAHLRSLRPHHTQEALGLNETRHLIAQLTAPMQQILVAISDTIARNEKQMAEVRDAEGTVDALRGKVTIYKTSVSAAQLDRPKTVCANEACVESVFDEVSREEKLLRKKLCHNPCCLTNVHVGQVGTPELRNCAAFEGEHCMLCRHTWREHEHILVEHAKRQETHDQGEEDRDVKNNIAGLKDGHMQVQTTAAKFSLCLKHNSITHYNDATVEYLEHLIKDERTKVHTGQSWDRLESLESDLDNYKKFAYVPLDESGVAKLVEKLYNLPHYGQMLKDLAQVVANAYEAMFRERPYRISRKKYWRGRDGPGPSDTIARGRLDRAFGPGKSSPGTVRHSEKSPVARPEQAQNELWPSEKQPSSTGPVRSITDWENAANDNGTGPSRAGRNGTTLASFHPPGASSAAAAISGVGS
ncbi:hypothetical protein BDW62DRAFT_197288 [Aspergillus aurantiobrunneus]